MKFDDPWNPKDAELRKWAYSDDDWPEQDFDLAIIDSNMETLLELASDPHCPKNSFFVHVLYLLVGNGYRLKKTDIKDELLEFINTIEIESGTSIEKWKYESIDLLTGKIQFSYDYWCQHIFSDATSNHQQ